jgi:hypothetical protein
MTNVVKFVPLPPERCANCISFTDQGGPYGICEKDGDKTNTDHHCDRYARSIRPEPAHDLAR